MKLQFKVSLQLVLLFLIFSHLNSLLVYAQEMNIEQLKAGVVKIKSISDGKRKLGTGIIVKIEENTAYILTASHVVLGDSQPKVAFFPQGNQFVIAHVVGLEGGNPRGLAALAVKENLPDGIQALIIDTALEVHDGTSVTLIGFPEVTMTPWMVTTGTIGGMEGSMITISAPIEEGNSGAPVFIANMVVALMIETRGEFGFAVPMSIAKLALKGWGIRPRPPGPFYAHRQKLAAERDRLRKEHALRNEEQQKWYEERQKARRFQQALAPLQSEQTIAKEESRSFQPYESPEGFKVKLAEEFISEDGSPMVLVPAGEFWMGSTSDEVERRIEQCIMWHGRRPDRKAAEKCSRGSKDMMPRHQVYLDTFYIDKYEVTLSQYLPFLLRTKEAASKVKQKDREKLEEAMQEFGDHPAFFVFWNHADAYCRQAGKRLPTEAEWEKAARGIVGRTYPWGNEVPMPNLANFGSKLIINPTEVTKQKLKPVGFYEKGKSPYGVYDMAGNVKEWVADWYKETYYEESPYKNPMGPATGQKKVYRGGGWSSSPSTLSSSLRGKITLDLPENKAMRRMAFSMGFRCAKDAS